MKKYDSYKDSGIDWIGEIPSHWDCKRLKHLVESPLKYGANEAAESDDPSQPRYIRITDFGQNGVLREDTFKSLPENLAKEYLLEEGDILLARSGATVGKTFLFQNYKGKACFAGYLIRCRFSKNQVDSRFINYYTFSNFYENWKQSIFQQATIQNIGADKYNQLLISTPPHSEQTLIANFLDQKTTQIDDLIAKKERLIQLLEEESTAVINRAVTQGFDDSIVFKDSGVDWLGKVPKHWELKRIRFVFEIIKRIAGELGHEVLSVTQQGIKVKDITSGAGQLSMDYSKYQLVEIGDFVMNHMDLLTGYVDKSKFMGVTSPDYRVFRAIDKIGDSEFFLYFFQMCYRNKIFFPLGQGSAQAGRWRLPTNQFRDFLIPVPPIDEQKIIVEMLQQKLKSIEKSQEFLKREIELIKEYKTALISEVVTGKVDVSTGLNANVRNEKLN